MNEVEINTIAKPLTPYQMKSFRSALMDGKLSKICMLNSKVTILKKSNVSFISILVNTTLVSILFEGTLYISEECEAS